MILDLTSDDIIHILSALSTVNSVGGGSATNRLLIDLMTMTGETPSEETITHLTRRALTNAEDAGAIIILHGTYSG